MKNKDSEKPIQVALREVVDEYAKPRGLNTDMIFNRVVTHFVRGRKNWMDKALVKRVPYHIAKGLIEEDPDAIEYVYQRGFRCVFTGCDTKGTLTNFRMELVDAKNKVLDRWVFTMELHRAAKKEGEQ